MISFLPISILAYALNGGSIVIDKILVTQRIGSPFVYTFYINLLALFTVVFLPFGVEFNIPVLVYSTLAGVTGNLALLAFFQSLKTGEASVVGPTVGFLNPAFTLIIGSLFLNQTITQNQFIAFLVLMIGGLVLTFGIWSKGLKINQQLVMIALAGLFFALSYLFLKEAFLVSNFMSGLVISRLAGALFALSFILLPEVRNSIFAPKNRGQSIKTTGLLLLLGQAMGAVQGLLLTFATSLANPALVNSVFGIQYLVILGVALILYKKHPYLLGEKLTKTSILQKVIGVIILSFGLYLLSK